MKIYENGIYREMTQKELETIKEISSQHHEIIDPPNQFDSIEAMATYTSLMTNTFSTEVFEQMTNMYEKIKNWYIKGLWTLDMVKEALTKKLITKEQYINIESNIVNKER